MRGEEFRNQVSRKEPGFKDALGMRVGRDLVEDATRGLFRGASSWVKAGVDAAFSWMGNQLQVWLNVSNRAHRSKKPMNPFVDLSYRILLLIALALEAGFLFRSHLKLWGPRIRLKLQGSPEMPDSLWRGLFFIGGVVCGVYAWVTLTSGLSLHPAIDCLGKLLSLGLGEILFLGLFDGWLLARELRR
jgi:hypothetical protein